MGKEREALLVLDMLNDFVRVGAPLEVPDNRKSIPSIQREIKKARRKGNPVIYVCDNRAGRKKLDRDISDKAALK